VVEFYLLFMDGLLMTNAHVEQLAVSVLFNLISIFLALLVLLICFIAALIHSRQTTQMLSELAIAIGLQWPLGISFLFVTLYSN